MSRRDVLRALERGDNREAGRLLARMEAEAGGLKKEWADLRERLCPDRRILGIYGFSIVVVAIVALRVYG